MDVVSVRYIVDDVAAAIDFYTRHLGFVLDFDAPGFASLSRGSLRLLVNAAQGRAQGAGGASQSMPDGRNPELGGWNRVQLQVTDLAADVDRLHAAGLKFRNDIVVGRGGSQILLEDPAGNLIELPARPGSTGCGAMAGSPWERSR